MKTAITGSVPARLFDVEAENLPSSSDSEDDDEIFEDSLSWNTSPTKSDTSDSNPSSDDTYYSLPDIEITAAESDLPSISGDISSTGRAVDTKCANRSKATALSLAHSGTGDKVTTTRPAKEDPAPSGKEIKILNFTGGAEKGSKVLNAGNEQGSNNFKATGMSDFQDQNDQPQSDSSDSGWITVKSSARAKSQSRSRTSPASQSNARQTGIAHSNYKPRTDSHIRTRTTGKTTSNKKLRGKVTPPKFTMRNPNSITPIRNQLHHRISLEPFLPPSTMVEAHVPTAGACARVSYSNVVGYSVGAERDVSTDLNLTAGNSDRSNSFENRNNVVTSSSLNVNAENETGDNTQSERDTSNRKSRASSNCSDFESIKSYRFSPAVGTPVMMNQFCNLHGEAQKDSLPMSEGENFLPYPSDSDFDRASRLNFVYSKINPLLKPVESWIWTPPESQSTNDNLSTRFSYALWQNDIYSDLLNSIGMYSNANYFSKPSYLDASNVNTSSVSEGASSSVKTPSAKSSNTSILRTGELASHPPREADKFYSFSGKNEPSNFLNTKECHTPIPFSSKESVACESPVSDNRPSLFQQANDVLESQNTTDTNISLKSIRDENFDLSNKNKSPTSPQNKNLSLKSSEKNISLKGKTEINSPTKSVPKYLFQRTGSDNRNEFTTTNIGETMMASSETSNITNVFPTCTDKVKAVHHTRSHTSSQSFPHSEPVHPVLKYYFPYILHMLSLSNSTSTDNIPVRNDSNSVSSQTFPILSNSNSAVSHTSTDNHGVPNTSTNHPLSNSVVFHTSIDCDTSTERLVSNIAEPDTAAELLVSSIVGPETTAERLVSNIAEPDIAAELLVSSIVGPDTTAERPLSNTAVPHSSTDQPVSSAAIPHNSNGPSVSSSAFHRALPEHPSSNDPFPPTANSNLATFRSPFHIEATQPQSLQPGTSHFLPLRSFPQVIAQPYNNLTWVPCVIGPQLPSFPSYFAFASPALYHSPYPQSIVFVPRAYAGHFTPQTNYPPVTEQNKHIPEMQHSSSRKLNSPAIQPNSDIQRMPKQSYIPESTICLVLNPRTENKYPESITFKQPSGHGLTTLTCETKSGRTYYSVSDWQFTDSDSDTDDSTFTELSQSELKQLSRKDFSRYFQILERLGNRGEHPIHPPSTKEPKSHGVNINIPKSKPSVKNQYPYKIILDHPSGRELTTLTLATQSGQNNYDVSDCEFTDSDSDADDSSFTELSQSEFKFLNRKDFNRYFRRLRKQSNSVAHPISSTEKTSKLPKLWFFWSGKPDNLHSDTDPNSLSGNLNGPSLQATVEEGMNLKIPISEKENKDVLGKEKQKRKEKQT